MPHRLVLQRPPVSPAGNGEDDGATRLHVLSDLLDEADVVLHVLHHHIADRNVHPGEVCRKVVHVAKLQAILSLLNIRIECVAGDLQRALGEINPNAGQARIAH